MRQNFFNLAFRALLRKEALATLKEKISRAILIGPLLIYTLLFGYVATFNLEHVPYALCDMSHSAASAEFVRALDASPIFERVETLASPSQLKDTVERGKALLILNIAPDYSKRLNAGKSAPIQVLVDGRNSSTAQLAAGYISQIAQALNEKHLGIKPAISIRFLFNPNNLTRWFIMPGIIVMLSMLQVIILSGLSVAREREQGTFEQLLVTPYSVAQLLAAKALVPTMIGLVQSSLILAIDIFWFGIPFSGSLVALYAILLLFILSVVGFALAISAYSKTMQQGLLFCFFALVPMVLLSGLLSPVANMPAWLQMFTYLDPLRFALWATRRVYLAGDGLLQVLPGMWPVIALACVSLPIAYHYFKKRL